MFMNVKTGYSEPKYMVCFVVTYAAILLHGVYSVILHHLFFNQFLNGKTKQLIRLIGRGGGG